MDCNFDPSTSGLSEHECTDDALSDVAGISSESDASTILTMQIAGLAILCRENLEWYQNHLRSEPDHRRARQG